MSTFLLLHARYHFTYAHILTLSFTHTHTNTPTHVALEAALTEPNLFFGVDFCSADGQAADDSEEAEESDDQELEAEQVESLEA